VQRARSGRAPVAGIVSVLSRNPFHSLLRLPRWLMDLLLRRWHSSTVPGARQSGSVAIVSDWKRMVSSRTVLRNSGLMPSFTSAMTFFFDGVVNSGLRQSPWKRQRLSSLHQYLAPMFEVMMRMTFLKSTVLPSPSVNWPSSRPAQQDVGRHVRVSAFSISSSRTPSRANALHALGQLAAFLVTQRIRRRNDQLGDRVLLHELRHIEADQRLV